MEALEYQVKLNFLSLSLSGFTITSRKPDPDAQGSTEPLNIRGLPPVRAEVSISRGQPPPALDSAGGTWPAKFFKLKLCQKARQRQSSKLSPEEQC